jgi:hypothetical protein
LNQSNTYNFSTASVLTVVLVLLPFVSGCSDLIYDLQNPGCRDVSETRETVDTVYGSFEIKEDIGNCVDSDTGRWRIYGPGSGAGELRVYGLEDRPEDIEVTLREPYWVRISASVGGKNRAWDYVGAKNLQGTLVGTRCDVQVFNSKDPSLQACLGDNRDGSWEGAARKFDRPTAFDKEAFALAAQASQAPDLAVNGLIYFRRTWDSRLHEDDGEMSPGQPDKAALRSLLRKAGCGPMVRATPQTWFIYLSAIDVMMADEADKLLAPCDSWLVENLSEQHEKLKLRLETPEVVRALDTALMARVAKPAPLDEQALGIWFTRLEHMPKPSAQLVDAMDQSLLSALESAAKEAAFTELQRERLRRRITFAAEFPFLPFTRERLDELLLTDIDRLGYETFEWIEHLSGTPRLDGFVQAIDARLVGIFPRGSQVFLDRLNDRNLPRPSDATRQAIVARARTMQAKAQAQAQDQDQDQDKNEDEAQEESITTASCLVVRRLLLLEGSDARSCELPETF